MRMLIKSALAEQGHSVEQAAEGRSALKLLNSLAPELIITDLLMPEKEGIETIIEIRKKNPKVKIIAISGGLRGGKIDLLELASKVGADRTLAKPFSVPRLIEMTADLLNSPAKKSGDR